MIATRNWMIPIVISYLTFSPTMAQMTTTETTETTTTVFHDPTVTTLTLSPGYIYNVVDPRTGAFVGRLDPSTNLVDGRPLTPGLIVTNELNGKVLAAVNSSGLLIDVAIIPASNIMIAAIDQRRDAFSRIITDSYTSGHLSAAEAAVIRAELDSIAASESAANKAGTLTYAETLVLAGQLDALQQQYPIIVTTFPAPLLKTHFILTGHTVQVTNEIAFRRVNLERRIDTEYRAGHLSTNQVASLKDQLNDICSREKKCKKDGILRDSDLHTLNVKLSRVQERLDSDIALIEGKRARMGITTE